MILHKRLLRAPLFSGDGFIAGEGDGILTVDGLPARRNVLVHDARTGKLVARGWSNPDGTYRVGGLNASRPHRVLGVDDEGEHDAVVADRIVPAQAEG